MRTIERGRKYAQGPVEIAWDGRDDAGKVLPEGEYKPRIRLRDDRTTYTLPNPMRIDVTPPRLELVTDAAVGDLARRRPARRPRELQLPAETSPGAGCCS